MAVDLRAAHLDRDVEPGLLVEAGGLGLIEAAVLGLRVPARQEGHLVGGVGAATGEQRERGSSGKRRQCGMRDMVCPWSLLLLNRRLRASLDADPQRPLDSTMRKLNVYKSIKFRLE